MPSHTLATNLLRMRRHQRLTQEELAEMAGLSRAGYRNLEKGRAEPKTETLRALATALAVPVRELVTPVPRLERVRFRSLKGLKRRDQTLAEVGGWLRDFNALEEILDARIEPPPGLLRGELSELGGGGIPAVAARVRELFGRSSREPIHDLCGLLEARGIKVLTLNVASEAFLGLSVAAADGGPAIVVNTWDRLAVEQWILSAAHELGHLVLHLEAYDVHREQEEEPEEREADLFASHFLMPEPAFLKEWNETAGLALLDRVLKVKRVFRTSWRTVLTRAAASLPPARGEQLWERLRFESERRYGRPLTGLDEPPNAARRPGGEPAGLDTHDFQEERLRRLVRRGVETHAISLARAAEVLDLSLDEMRELSRSWVS